MIDDAETGTPATKAKVAKSLEKCGVHMQYIALSNLLGVHPHLLHKPDLFYRMYKGIVNDTIIWLVGFLKKHKRFNCFNKV